MPDVKKKSRQRRYHSESQLLDAIDDTKSKIQSASMELENIEEKIKRNKRNGSLDSYDWDLHLAGLRKRSIKRLNGKLHSLGEALARFRTGTLPGIGLDEDKSVTL